MRVVKQTPLLARKVSNHIPGNDTFSIFNFPLSTLPNGNPLGPFSLCHPYGVFRTTKHLDYNSITPSGFSKQECCCYNNGSPSYFAPLARKVSNQNQGLKHFPLSIFNSPFSTFNFPFSIFNLTSKQPSSCSPLQLRQCSLNRNTHQSEDCPKGN